MENRGSLMEQKQKLEKELKELMEARPSVLFRFSIYLLFLAAILIVVCNFSSSFGRSGGLVYARHSVLAAALSHLAFVVFKCRKMGTAKSIKTQINRLESQMEQKQEREKELKEPMERVAGSSLPFSLAIYFLFQAAILTVFCICSSSFERLGGWYYVGLSVLAAATLLRFGSGPRI